MQNINSEAATFEALQLRVVIDEHGNKQYYNHDNELHRTDGPAIIFENGEKYWYINGNQFTEAEFLKHPLCTIK